MDGRELHENLVKLQQQVYPPAQNDGDGRPVDVHRDSGAVHDVTCKECGNQVVGVRYKCGVCSNHDICSECEANGVHDKHIMFRFAGAVNEVGRPVCRVVNETRVSFKGWVQDGLMQGLVWLTCILREVQEWLQCVEEIVGLSLVQISAEGRSRVGLASCLMRLKTGPSVVQVRSKGGSTMVRDDQEWD